MVLYVFIPLFIEWLYVLYKTFIKYEKKKLYLLHLFKQDIDVYDVQHYLVFN